MFVNTGPSKSTMDSRVRHQVLFRPNLPRLASDSRPHRPSHSPKVVESRIYGQARPPRNDGWDSTRWNYHAPYTKGNFQFERVITGWRTRYPMLDGRLKK